MPNEELEARVRRYVKEYREWMNDDEGGYDGLIEIAGEMYDECNTLLDIDWDEDAERSA